MSGELPMSESQPAKTKPKPKPSRTEEARRMVQEDIDQQRVILEELGRQLN
jgi:hypothetical protein